MTDHGFLGPGPGAGATALVTGAAKRLGRAIALGLAGAGHDVVVHHRRSADEAGRVAGEIRALGRRAWTVQADLAEPGAAEDFWGRAVEAAGPIDILINNASIYPSDRVTDMTVDALLLSVRLHAAAPLVLARLLAAQGRPGRQGGQGQGGRRQGGQKKVVNMLDARMVDYDRAHASYHLGKRMAYTLTRMLALELAPNVTVNAVAPGAILPPPGESEAAFRKLADAVPLKAVGNEGDIVRAVLWLVASEFITGQVIFVDGGRHLRGRVYD